jgi:hypothetical protein
MNSMRGHSCIESVEREMRLLRDFDVMDEFEIARLERSGTRVQKDDKEESSRHFEEFSERVVRFGTDLRNV